MDPNNEEDRKDIFRSKNTINIKKDFHKAYTENNNSRDFYILQNDKTGEVISCAETTHRYRTEPGANYGLYTLIEEMDENSKYINAAEPTLAYIVKRAQDRFDLSVYTAFGEDKIPSLKREKFTENNLGEFYIPHKRFNSMIDKAEEHSQIEYTA